MISRGMRLASGLMLFLAIVVASSAALIPGGVHARGGVISAISVSGNQRIEAATVKSYMKISPGQRYDAGLVDESLKALFATGLFADVSITRRGSTLLVSVEENPIINRVAFEGNKKLKDKELSAAIELRPRTVYTRAKVQSDVQRIVEMYRRSGRFTARVEPKIIRRSQQRVDLVFEINEGPQTSVVNINFIGNKAYSDSKLRSVVSTSEYSWWDFFSNSDRYDPDRLNFDRELLRRFYLKNGYADFRVVSAVAELDRDQKNFFITFTVEEGERYKFGTVEIESGIDELDPDALGSEVLTREKDVYDASAIDKTIENISLQAGTRGFAFARVRPRADKDEETRTINLTYLIEEGPRVYVERINIIGNTRTLDNVIRREFRLVEGDAFNRVLVNRARKKLLGLGFFSKVDITTERGSAPDKVVINVTVEEKSTGEVALGVGYSTIDAVVGDISITERNLMGRGQYLRLSTSISKRRQQIDVRFTEPYFLGRNMSFGVDIFGTDTDLTRESGFKSRQTGAGLRFGFPLGEDLYLNTRYSLTRDKVFGLTTGASTAVQQARGTSWVSQGGYTLTYDTLDNPVKPTTGIKVQFDQDIAGLGGDVFFVRTSAKGIIYRSLFEDVIGSIKVSGGHILGWNGKKVRIMDAFFKGYESVRGFDRSGYGPRDAATGDALGGRTYATVNSEVQFPIGLPKKFGITAAVFADAGTLYNKPDSGTAAVRDDASLRASVGASLLWASPVGPLRFDFAKVLKKESYDETRFFNFSAGMRF